MRVLAFFIVGMATAAAMPIPPLEPFSRGRQSPQHHNKPPTIHYVRPPSEGAEDLENPKGVDLLVGGLKYALAGGAVWGVQRWARLAVRRKRIANCVQEMVNTSFHSTASSPHTLHPTIESFPHDWAILEITELTEMNALHRRKKSQPINEKRKQAINNVLRRSADIRSSKDYGHRLMSKKRRRHKKMEKKEWRRT